MTQIQHQQSTAVNWQFSKNTAKTVRKFNILANITHAVGLCMVFLTFYISANNPTGLGWEESAQAINIHGLTAAIGFVFFQGEAVVTYRVLRFQIKQKPLYIHAFLHLLAILSNFVSATAVLHAKNLRNSSHFISLHAWLGLIIYGAYVFQFITGFTTFLYPGSPPIVRKDVKRWHSALGVVLIMLTLCVILMKCDSFSSPFCTSTSLTCDNGYRLIHGMTFCTMVVYTGLVAWLTLNPKWQRYPLPSDD